MIIVSNEAVSLYKTFHCLHIISVNFYNLSMGDTYYNLHFQG